MEEPIAGRTVINVMMEPEKVKTKEKKADASEAQVVCRDGSRSL